MDFSDYKGQNKIASPIHMFSIKIWHVSPTNAEKSV